MTSAELATVPAETSESLVKFAARLLTGLHLVNDSLIRTTATVSDDGWVTWNVTRCDFSTGPDDTVRVQFHPTAPVPVTGADSGEPT